MVSLDFQYTARAWITMWLDAGKLFCTDQIAELELPLTYVAVKVVVDPLLRGLK